MNDPKIKQQIVEKIKASTNILVTVSNNPSVDALSAALGLTLVLNKLGKHATAIFSGAIPPAITFLDPAKVFEASTDSLRDFIIALDKEKADHLRYKVEGDVVKIFITPYRTTITGDDLEFSQGDYNVELVLGLGIENQSHLDSALEAHGRILHDATVATLSAGTETSSLGSLDWHEDQASSLSEMLVGLIEAFKTDKDQKPLLDQQTATAILTGIVAETDRFSNTKTSSKVMTVAAQLMAAGADQQLIASKLQEAHTIGQPQQAPVDSIKIDKTTPPETTSLQGAVDISHPTETLEDIANKVKQEDQQEAAVAATELLHEQTAPTVVAPPVIAPVIEPVLPPIQVTNAYAPESVVASAEVPTPVAEPLPDSVASPVTPAVEQPSTPVPEPYIETSAISSHAYLGASPVAPGIVSDQTPAESVDIFAGNSPATPESDSLHSAYAPELSITPPTLEVGSDTGVKNRDESSRDDALAAVHATFGEPGFSPAPGVVLPAPPPLPDFSAMGPPPVTNAYALEPPVVQPERLGDIFAPEPSVVPTQPASTDPAQFKIPGQ